jgi:predicted acyl esterase
LRRTLALLVSVSLLCAVPLLPSGAATSGALARDLTCKEKKAGKKVFRFCSGSVTSFDGVVELDADVTLPGKGKGPFPLVVINHGLGGSKESHESDTVAGSGGSFHYTNLWFASRGYAVLNYTARGFHEDECLDDSVQSSDAEDFYPSSPACLPQLDHVDYEVRDTQYLVGRLVDGTLLRAKGVTVKPKKIGVTGVSYGAGQTWLLTRRNKWTSPKGTAAKLAAAVPVIGWTDLGDALLPSGQWHEGMIAPSTVEERLAETPGVLKESYVDAFYFLLNQASSTPFSLPGYLKSWYERAGDGAPYDDATSLDFLRSVVENRSALYVDRVGGKTPILAMNGWTDEIFPAIQPLQMFEKLKAEDSGYPISVYLGDWGHPIAQNPESDTKRQAKLANKWLDWYLKGAGTKPGSWVSSSETLCAAAGEQTDSVAKGANLAALQTDSLDVVGEAGALDTQVDDPHAVLLDPVTLNGARNACRDTDTAVAAGNIATTVPLPIGATMLGLPSVTLTAAPTAPHMYIAFRLWDVGTTGRQVLVDRGIYRLGDAGSQPVMTRLRGNHYEFLPGHSLKLELTANDGPTFSYPDAEGTIGITDLEFSIPLD